MDELIPTIVSCYDIKTDIEALHIYHPETIIQGDAFLVPADEIVNAVISLNEGETSITHLPIIMQERIYESIQKRVNDLGRVVRASGEAVFELDGKKILYVAVRTAQLH